MRIILNKRKLDKSTRIIKAFLTKPLELPFEDKPRQGIVYIFQRYRYDNGYSSGVYKGWYWDDVTFKEKLK